jgi:hypothetical protein
MPMRWAIELATFKAVPTIIEKSRRPYALLRVWLCKARNDRANVFIRNFITGGTVPATRTFENQSPLTELVKESER